MNSTMTVGELIAALQQIAAHESEHTPTTVVNVSIVKHTEARHVQINVDSERHWAPRGSPVGLLRAQ